MKKAILLGTTSIALAFAMLATGFIAGKPSAVADDSPQIAEKSMDRAEVEQIVREYLVANPEILAEMQAALDAKQKEEQRIASLQVIEQNRAEIFQSPHDGIVGNPDGKITIVEFYDYNCGFCKRAQDDMLALTAANPNLRFVLKEFPILGPDSQKAHVVSQAFQYLMPEKYADFHNQLLGSRSRASEASAIKVAVSLGADEAALREAMKDPRIVETFNQTYDLANKLAITGTPSYVVGNEVVFGALGKDVLAEKIAAAEAACTADAC
ncbi:MAG: DsbA family protein [Rhizobiaceae bacterium]|nr:DsbA family protein [Rhizobiaceae bacterium]